jgi:APA family basic amino acid/polyamine antiporter
VKSGAQDARRTHSPPGLLRVLGLGFGIAVVVGGVVGQGILRTPGIVAGAFPHPAWILGLWLAGGVLAAISALALVELAASIPRAGGPYVFAEAAFGPLPGVIIGWSDYLNGAVVVSFVSVVFSEYLQRLGVLRGVPVGVIAITVIVSVGAINWTGTRTSGLSQSIGSALKGLGLLLLITLLFATPAVSRESEPSPMLSLAAIAIAMRAIQSTYGGWGTPAYFSEELHNPERNIARAVFGGILLVTVLYVLVNAALLHVLTPEQIAASTFPAADAARVVLGPRADAVVSTVALVSLFSLANVFLMFLSRLAYAMARRAALPARVAQVSASGTPRVALAMTALICASLAATGSYEQLLAMGTSLTILIDASVNASAIRMRLREPALARPFRMPLFPAPAILGLVVNTALLAAVIYEDPVNSSLGIGAIALLAALYKAGAFVARKRLPRV